MVQSLWENLMEFLSEKIYITLTPSSTKNKVKNYSFQRYVPVALILLLVIGIGILSCNYLYYKSQYMQTKTNFKEYKQSANIDALEKENRHLKRNLLVLSQNTEELKASLRNLRQSNQEIRQLLGKDTNINDNNKINDVSITSILDYNSSILNQGVPMGGRKLDLYYQKPKKLLSKMQKDIDIVEESIEHQREAQRNLKDNAVEYKDMRASIPKIWPLADSGNSYISSNFGWRIDPISNQQEYHEGLDIAVWYNTPVLATAPGKITFVGWNGGYGLSLEIDHGNGYTTYYAHLNKSKVSKGDKVEKGGVVGLTGNSGKSTGPHLHYEVRINGVPKNPRKFIGR